MNPLKKGIRSLLQEGPAAFGKRCTDFVFYRSRDAVYELVTWRYESIVVYREELKRLASELYELDRHSDLPSPDEQEELNPLETGEYAKLRLEPTFTFEQPFVAVLSDVTIAGDNGLAYTRSGKIVGETVDFDAKNEVFTIERIHECLCDDVMENPVLITSLLLTGATPGTDKRYTRAAILLGRSHSYFQWIAYHLPKLRGIEFYSETTGRDVHLIIPPDPPSYVVESLELLGYDSEDYTEWEHGAAAIEELVVPSFPEPTPELVHWLRERILPNVEDSQSGPDWIYISRQQANMRRVENFTAVKSVLDEFGVEIVELEAHSLAEQIQLVRGAEGIIGPHGAGLLNMIWADELSVVEIFGGVVDAPFFIIADVLEHDYAALSGRQPESGEADRNADIVVDVQELRELLREMIAS